MRRVEELQNVLKGYSKISILGHDNIDVDAFLSGVLFSHLLSYLNVENEFIILEEVKENESYQIVLEMCNINMKDFYKENEDSGRELLLEDHYQTKHAGKVIACLDHHPTTDEIKYEFYHSRISCSTSYMIYELMLECDYPLSKDEAKMILVSMMVDTVSFRSAKTVKDEVVNAKLLAKQFNLDYEAIEKYCLCLTPIEKMSMDEIVNNGYKYYNYEGNKVKSSYLQLYSLPEQDLVELWITYIISELDVDNLKMWVFILFECKNEITYEYHITENGFQLVKTRGILSRGTNIMPKIEKMFQKK